MNNNLVIKLKNLFAPLVFILIQTFVYFASANRTQRSEAYQAHLRAGQPQMRSCPSTNPSLLEPPVTCESQWQPQPYTHYARNAVFSPELTQAFAAILMLAVIMAFKYVTGSNPREFRIQSQDEILLSPTEHKSENKKKYLKSIMKAKHHSKSKKFIAQKPTSRCHKNRDFAAHSLTTLMNASIGGMHHNASIQQFLTSVGLFVVSVADSKTWVGIVSASASLIRAHYSISTELFSEYLATLAQKIFFKALIPKSCRNYWVQGLDDIFHTVSTNIRRALENWTAFRTCDIAAKTTVFISSIIALVAFPSFEMPAWITAATSTLEIAQPLLKNASSLLEAALSLTSTLFDRIAQCIARRSFAPLFSPNSTKLLDEEYSRLNCELISLEGETEARSSVEISLLLNDCDKLGENYKTLLTSGVPQSVRSILVARLSKLSQLKVGFNAYFKSGSSRAVPYSINLLGDTGVGKSTITTLVMQIVFNEYNVNYDPSLVATMSEYDKYDSVKNSTLGICMDDISSTLNNPDANNRTASRIIQVINSAPFPAVKAGVEDKHTTFPAPIAVVTSTNSDDMGMLTVSTHPAAIYRRFDLHIQPVARPEYCAEGSSNLDPSLIPEGEVEVCFYAATQVKAQGSNFIHQIVKSLEGEAIMPLGALLRLISSRVRSHKLTAQRSLNKITALAEAKFCEHDIQELYCDQCHPRDFPDTSDMAPDSFRPNHARALRASRNSDQPLRARQASIRGGFGRGGSTRGVSRDLHVQSLDIFSVRLNMIHNLCTTIYSLFGLTYYDASISLFKISDFLERSRKYLLIPIVISVFYHCVLSAILLLLIWYYTLPVASKLRDCGEKIQSYMDNYRLDVFLAQHERERMYKAAKLSVAAITVVGLAYKLCKATKYMAQAEYFKPDEVSCPKYYVGPPPNRVSSKSRNMTPQQLENTVVKASVTIHFKDSNRKSTGRGIIIQRNILITCAHNLRTTDESFEIEVVPYNKKRLSCHRVYHLMSDSVKTLAKSDSDIAAVMLIGSPPHRDITDLLATEINLPERVTMVTPTQRINGDPVRESTLNLSCPNPDGSVGSIRTTGWIIDYGGEETQPGQSGAPVFSNCEKPFLLGIHSGGDSNYGIVSTFTRDQIIDLISSLSGFQIHNLDNSRYPDIISMNEDEPPHRKSFMREGGLGVYIGRVLERQHFKSSVKNTSISDLVTEHTSIPPMHQQPGGIQVGSEKFHKYAPYAGPSLDPSILREAEDDYLNQIMPLAPSFQPVPISIAVSGQDGVSMVCSLPMSTSGGKEFPGPKRNYFTPDIPNEYITYPMKPNEDLSVAIDRVTQRLAAGLSSGTIFTGQPKDEPVGLTEPGVPAKQRIFMSGPVDFNVVGRMMLLGFIKWHRETPGTESAVGTDMTSSSQVQSLYADLMNLVPFSEISKRCGAGDYKAYDLVLPPQVLNSIANIIMHLVADFTPFDKAVTQGVLSNVIWPTIAFDGTISVLAINPSGHFATTDFNCIGNSILVRYCYFRARRSYFRENHLIKTPFRKHVALVVYGDDNIYAISTDCPFFDQLVLTEQLSKIGITYTSEDKTSKVAPLRDFFELSFLSRTVTLTDGVWKAYLSDKSISKMLHFQKKSELSSFNRSWEGIQSALFEFYLRTPEEYALRKEQLRAIAYESGMHGLWDDETIDESFAERSR